MCHTAYRTCVGHSNDTDYIVKVCLLFPYECAIFAYIGHVLVIQMLYEYAIMHIGDALVIQMSPIIYLKFVWFSYEWAILYIRHVLVIQMARIYLKFVFFFQYECAIMCWSRIIYSKFVFFNMNMPYCIYYRMDMHIGFPSRRVPSY